MKLVDVKSSAYINFNKEISNEDPKFKIGDNVTTPRYKNIFVKGYLPNWSEEVFMIKKVKNTVRRTLLAILKAKKFLEYFITKNFKKQIKKSFELKK